MHSHGVGELERKLERKGARGGGGMSKLDTKKDQAKQNTLKFTCCSVGFQIVIKPSLGLSFLSEILEFNPTTLTLINGVTSLTPKLASSKAFSTDFSMSDCLVA